eukprot:363918-Chlamydomonas_euryale.AAC.10
MLAAALVVAVGRDHVRVRRTRIRIALAIPPPLVRRHEIVLRHRDRRARLRCRRGREGLSCRSRCCRRIRRPCPRLTHRVLLRHAARWQWERRRCRTAGCAAVIGRRRVLGVARRQREKRYLAALPVIQHHARRGVEVWLAALQQLPRAARNLREEVLAICPLFELVRTPLQAQARARKHRAEPGVSVRNGCSMRVCAGVNCAPHAPLVQAQRTSQCWPAVSHALRRPTGVS